MRQHRPSPPGFAKLVPSQLATLPRRSIRLNPISPSIWEIQVVGIGGNISRRSRTRHAPSTTILWRVACTRKTPTPSSASSFSSPST